MPLISLLLLLLLPLNEFYYSYNKGIVLRLEYYLKVNLHIYLLLILYICYLLHLVCGREVLFQYSCIQDIVSFILSVHLLVLRLE